MSGDDQHTSAGSTKILLCTVIGYVLSFVGLLASEFRFHWMEHSDSPLESVAKVIYAPLLWLFEYILGGSC